MWATEDSLPGFRRTDRPASARVPRVRGGRVLGGLVVVSLGLGLCKGGKQLGRIMLDRLPGSRGGNLGLWGRGGFLGAVQVGP